MTTGQAKSDNSEGHEKKKKEGELIKAKEKEINERKKERTERRRPMLVAQRTNYAPKSKRNKKIYSFSFQINKGIRSKKRFFKTRFPSSFGFNPHQLGPQVQMGVHLYSHRDWPSMAGSIN